MFDDNQGRRLGDNDDRDGDDNDFDDGDDDCDDNHVGVSMLYLTHNNVKIIEWHLGFFFSYYRESMQSFDEWEKITGQLPKKFVNALLNTNIKTQSLKNLIRLFFVLWSPYVLVNQRKCVIFGGWLYEGRWRLQMSECGKVWFRSGAEILEMDKRTVTC